MEGGKKKPKVKVFKDKKGRYIRLKKKKIRIADNITERELLKFVIQTLKPKRRKRKEKIDLGVNKHKKVDPITTGVSKLIADKNSALEEQRAQFRTLRGEVQQAQLLAPNAVQPIPQIQPPPTLAITSGKKDESKKSKYTEEQIEEGVKAYEQTKRQKDMYKLKAEKERKQVIAEKIKQAEAQKQQSLKELRLYYTPIYISNKYGSKDLQKLATSAGVSSSGTKLQMAEALMKVNKLPMKTDEVKVGLLTIPEYASARAAIEADYQQMVDDAEIEEIDTSVLSTPQKSSSAAASSSSPMTGRGSDKGMSTDQINSVMKKYKQRGYLGTIGSDQCFTFIPKIKPHTRVSWIMNAEKSTQAGDHWVGVMLDSRPNGSNSVEFYNSLGKADRPFLLKPFLRHIRPILSELQPETLLTFKENLIPDQNATSSNCGEFSIKFLEDRYAGKSFSEASGFNSKAEPMIEKFKKTLPKFRVLEYDQQTGEGKLRDLYNKVKTKVGDAANFVANRVKDVLGGYRLKFPPAVRSLLEKYSNDKIIAIKVLREPINSKINTILNWLSGGVFEENLKKSGYDFAFHLYMYVKLSTGTTIRFDKNQVVHAKIVNFDHHGKNVETISVATPNTTLGEFLNKGIKKAGESSYFIYSSGSDNCQQWIKDNLSGNGLWNDSVNKFVMQDAKKIYENLGLLEKINQKITDISHGVDVVIHGAGKKKCKCES
jgi:hypothetical protein